MAVSEREREANASAAIPPPSRPALNFRGRSISPDYLVELWDRSTARMRNSRATIKRCRDVRRKELSNKLSPQWVERHPEASTWVPSLLTDRVTLDQDLIARVCALEPSITRTPLGWTDRDEDAAAECRSYLEEWKRQAVPVEDFGIKSVEDGQFAVVVLPAELDIDGSPDFYDRLDDEAYEHLEQNEQRNYRRDDGDRRKRWTRMDERGPVPARRWDRDAAGRERAKSDEGFKRDPGRSETAYQRAWQAYLLGRSATVIRIIPALDCAPILVRGTGRQRWELVGLVERTLYEPDDLIARDWGWSGMGTRAMIPRGYNAGRSTGQDGQLYLYTAYLMCKDEQGRNRPCIFYSVGGKGTWEQGRQTADKNSVVVIDLFERYGGHLTTPLWSYHGGLHGGDDEPDHYWRPYLDVFVEPILSIEGTQMAIKATVEQVSYTGHYYKPDADLAAVDDEAIVERDTGQLRVPKMPRPGDIEPTAGDLVPAHQARVGDDAWRMLALEKAQLDQATMADKPGGAGSDASGHALVVGETLAQVSKRQIRQGIVDALESVAEKQLRILNAIYHHHDVRWPIQTTEERVVGHEIRKFDKVLEFDPRWVEQGQFRVRVEYPEEANLAEVDLVSSLAMKRQASFEDVQKARGKPDAFAERLKIAEDMQWETPQYQALLSELVMRKRGDRIMQAAAALQQDQRLTPAGPPGFENGVPTAALRRPGEPPMGGSMVSRARGGIEGGQKGTASRMRDASAQLNVGQQVGV